MAMYDRDMVNHKRRAEQGIVSILTVLFLTILLSVLTVAFLRIVNDEQDQTINDDLTKSAYASALSGVEDAKRAIVYCYGRPTAAQRNACIAALTNPNCPGAIRPSTVLTNGSPPVLNPSGQVGGDPNLNQSYSCLLVDLTPDNYENQASTTPRLISLNSDGSNFNQITVRWHRVGNGETQDGPGVFSTQPANPRDGNWTNTAGEQAVDMLRLQIVAYEPSSGTTVTQDDLDDKTAAAYFVPRSSASIGNLGRISAPRSGEWSFSAGTKQDVACNAAGSFAGYSCETTLRFSGGPANLPRTGNSEYFLMVSSVYGDPHYEVRLSNGPNGVDIGGQPEIDVTGSAADVFRRVKARVEFQPGFTPKEAVQSGGSICKGFYVTADAYRPGTSPATPLQRADGAVCTGLTISGNQPVTD